MRPTAPSHPWDLPPREAIALQRELAGLVVAAPPAGFAPVRVAGVDVAFPGGFRAGGECVAAAVAWDVESRRIVEERVVRRPARFPYLPGLLSFREAPAVLAALEALRVSVDAILCDGHGVAHPRAFGLACHVGVLVGTPTVGAAKSPLVGGAPEVGPRRGDRSPVLHRGERVGTVLRTRDRVRPLYVSVGHLLDLEAAESLVLACGGGFRLPEPTRRADRLAGSR